MTLTEMRADLANAGYDRDLHSTSKPSSETFTKFERWTAPANNPVITAVVLEIEVVSGDETGGYRSYTTTDPAIDPS